jgi:molybdate-binding protein/DNA-binding transcriptional regulator YhcF (GntR family)
VGKQAHIYEKIAESLRRQIVDGKLAAGDRLPAVRAMARDWSCTPGTVHRAYQILSEEGLIVSRRGKGTRVAAGPLQPLASGTTGGIQAERLQWVALVHRAEQYLLEAATAGYSIEQAQGALTLAMARWRSMREPQLEADHGAAATRTLRFSGSHDLLVEHLVNVMENRTPAIEIEARFSGSLGGLLALMRGEADVAGIHLWDEASDTYNEPYVRRLFPGIRLRLLTLAHRSLGFIVPPGTAVEWSALEALGREGVRLANRQRGSGTRLWLDAQLRRLNIDHTSITGYASELTTHTAVAKEVAAGRADVGIGIQGAASAFGLDFMPLVSERYDLVFADERWDSVGVRALRQLVRDDAFKEMLEALGGYDGRESGHVRQI